MRVFYPLSAVAGMVFVVFAAACGNISGPEEGLWDGDHLRFEIHGDKVVSPSTKGISCKGDNGCFKEANRYFPSVEWEISGHVYAGSATAPKQNEFSFSGTLEHSHGTIEISGGFDSASHALGTFVFIAADGCCTAEGEWRAELVAPLDNDEDTGSGLSDVVDTPDGGDASGPHLDISGPGLYPPSATEYQILAENYVNQLRATLDIPYLVEVEPINQAAQAHAEYYELHCDSYLGYQISAHSENVNWQEGFTGVNFDDRMKHFGWKATAESWAGWEVMSFNGDAIQAIDGWVDTLYHRIPFVHPNAFEMGFGMTKGGCSNWSGGTDVMDFSRYAKVDVDEAVAYPYHGQINVDTQWNGAEMPQPPLPAGHNYPSGPIITLTFPNGTKPDVASHELLGPGDVPVPHQWVTPENDPAQFLQSTVSLYSLDPLAGNTLHTVRIVGKWKNVEQAWEWQFTTGPHVERWH